jgi:crotonobetainyl-CoA:carnitine CoA-transferase CaiB-like acyl-CoA transferase
MAPTAQTLAEWADGYVPTADDLDLAQRSLTDTLAVRVAHRDTLEDLISARFDALDTDTVVTLLNQAGVANARLLAALRAAGVV